MTAEIIPEKTTLEIGSSDVFAVCDCHEQRACDLLHATSIGDHYHGAVLVRRDGTVTNRYQDGVVGVTEEDAQLAEVDEELFCPDCDNYIRGWLHPADRPE